MGFVVKLIGDIMDVVEQFLQRLTDYRELEKIVKAESPDADFPSEARKEFWQAGNDLRTAFRDAVKDVLLN